MNAPHKITFAVPRAVRSTERKRGARQFLLLAAILVSAVAASAVILKFAPAPFFWLWLIWAAFLFASIFVVHGSWPRAILFNLGIVACLLAATEAHYFCTEKYAARTVSDGFYAHDDVLGWAPTKGIQAHVIKANPGALLHHPVGLMYDVRYTIDSNGLRVAPSYSKNDLAGTIVFLGCSYAFGSGLEDNETLPYQVGVQSGGRYRTFNFSFEGYSPAQMLAEIEHGIVGRLVDGSPQRAYYIAIPHHVWRVAGRVPWIQHEPRYVLDADGTVHQEGFFEVRKPLAERLGFGRRVVGQLDKSSIWRLFSMGESRVSDDDVRLYFAMVRRSKELLSTQYPGIQFRIILWPNQDVPQERAIYEKMRDGFRRMEIPVDLVEDILPGYNSNREKFQISSSDDHPNALANRLLAQYLLNQIAK
jgi:hypothetical protein